LVQEIAMRSRIQTVPKSFRLSEKGSRELEALADAIERHPAELIREAVTRYVRFQRHKLHLPRL
jgi:predicted transcriptional regulator